ncbi:MAG TPA: hypothetical protein VL493_08390 [Candidatus Saccharimonadales bacterium]|nr:hypothetical protein [Candidatus Saccharimonadales bacterium]
MNRIVAALVVIAIVVLLAFNALWSEWPFVLIPIAVSPLAFVGALLIARVPRNVVGWLLAASGLLFAGSFAGNSYAWVALVSEGGRWPGGELAAAIAAALFTPALSFAVLMLLFFPSGRGLGGRWTWVERFFVVFVAVLIGANFLKDVPIEIPVENGRSIVFANPFAANGLFGQIMTALGHLGDSWSVPLVLVGPLSLFVRYRRSDPVERHQIKWLAYTGTVSLALIVASNLTGGDLSNWLWVTGACLLGLLPIAIALAIFRYRLYDIDVLIRRTVIYATVSAMLLATYVAVVALLEFVLAPVTGGSGVAVAISTLAVVALFQPLRRRIQGAVDHRFYRAKYDADRTVDAFAARLREQVDLGELRADLLGAVGETLRPASASVWLRGPRQ